MNSNAQNALIVSGKSQKQKQCAVFSGRGLAPRQCLGPSHRAANFNRRASPASEKKAGLRKVWKVRVGSAALSANFKGMRRFESESDVTCAAREPAGTRFQNDCAWPLARRLPCPPAHR